MTPEEFSRSQLIQCCMDLAKRAKELDEPYMTSVLYALAGAANGDVDDELAEVVSKFCKKQLALMDEDFDGYEDDEDDDEEYEET